MKLSCFVCLIGFFFSSISVNAQQKTRDAIKIGGGYNLITLEDAFAPVAYIEYSRLFLPPITIGVSANYSKADNIKTVFENRQLTTFSFDLMAYYSFFDDPKSDMRVGFMMSARSFFTEWQNISTFQEGSSRQFHPGVGLILNYDFQFSDLLLIGAKGSFVQYNNSSAVFLFGMHVGLIF